MKYTAINIHPDPSVLTELKALLGDSVTIHGFPTEEQALDWLVQTDTVIDFAFINWSLSKQSRTLINSLGTLSHTQKALVFKLTTPEDLDWVGTLFSLGQDSENILIKPFPPGRLREHLTKSIHSPINADSGVLLVDDDTASRHIICEYLKHYGFTHIFEANDGQEALELLEENKSKIAVIVSDWEMPNVNGIQLLKEIRQSADSANIPFIMVTSQTSIEEIKHIQAAEEGVTGYLNKPFDLKHFKGQLQNIFSEINTARMAQQSILEARTLMAHGKHAEAVSLLEQTTNATADSSDLWEALGDAQASLEDKSRHHLFQASESYKKAVTLSASRTTLILKFFESLLALGRVNEAIRLLKNHVGHKSLDEQLRLRLAKAYVQNGMYDLAHSELNKVLNLNPSHAEAKSLSQVVHSLQGKQFKKTG